NEQIPFLRELAKFVLPRRRQPVVLPWDAAIRRRPANCHEPRALKPVQHRVQRAVSYLQRAVGLLGELGDDLVAIGLARFEQVQDDELERPPPELTSDALPLV